MTIYYGKSQDQDNQEVGVVQSQVMGKNYKSTTTQYCCSHIEKYTTPFCYRNSLIYPKLSNVDFNSPLIMDDVEEDVTNTLIHFKRVSMRTKNISPRNRPVKSRCSLDHGLVSQLHGWSGAAIQHSIIDAIGPDGWLEAGVWHSVIQSCHLILHCCFTL